jgi:hypothetical protein
LEHPLVASSDWLARGGTYYVLAFVWIVSAIFYYIMGARLGNQTGQPNDGCLIGICNIILALLGGGFGFLILIHYYPYFILSSIVCAIGFPASATLYFANRFRRKT